MPAPRRIAIPALKQGGNFGCLVNCTGRQSENIYKKDDTIRPCVDVHS